MDLAAPAGTSGLATGAFPATGAGAEALVARVVLVLRRSFQVGSGGGVVLAPTLLGEASATTDGELLATANGQVCFLLRHGVLC